VRHNADLTGNGESKEEARGSEKRGQLRKCEVRLNLINVVVAEGCAEAPDFGDDAIGAHLMWGS